MRKGDRPSACWIWIGSTDPEGGYGSFMSNRKHYPAHRFAWQLRFGEIPDGLFVCHHCDNPPCVNVEHLFLGTTIDNTRDRIEKERREIERLTGEGPLPTSKLIEIHTRLFQADIDKLKAVAQSRGIPWQVELRLLVRRTLKAEMREVLVLKEQP